MGTKNNDITLQNCGSNEEIFVLRANDESSPTTIMFWIVYNMACVPEEKLREAFEQALKMNRQENRRRAT